MTDNEAPNIERRIPPGERAELVLAIAKPNLPLLYPKLAELITKPFDFSSLNSLSDK